jgi:hypothetical protein
MRLKAIEGCPNTAARLGWLEETNPAGVILYKQKFPDYYTQMASKDK